MKKRASTFAVYIVVTAFVLTELIFAGARSALAEEPAHAQFAIVFPLLAPKLTSTFGNRNHPVFHYQRHHSGVDLAAPESSHVRAVAEGLVVFADTYKGYGKLVTIQHAQGFVSMYGHLSAITVNPGQKVTAGDIVGRVGSTGVATGPHLHFEWRHNQEIIDPLRVFPNLMAKAQG